MASFKDYLTVEGERMLAKAAAGTKIEFTRVVAGSGYMASGASERNMTALISPVLEMTAPMTSINSSDSIIISAYMSNEAVSSGFYFREKGIYVTDGKEEVLAIYGNNGSNAEFIDTTDVCVIEKKIRTVVSITSQEAANIVLNGSSYAPAPVTTDAESIADFVNSAVASTMSVGQTVIIKEVVYTLVKEDVSSPESYVQSGGESEPASDEVAGVVRLSNSHTSIDGTESGTAATPLAVKTAYDKAAEAYKKATTVEDQIPVLPETPSTRTNIADGDSLGTMLAKIKKWLSDLKAGAFAAIANNCTTTASGSVLDARQGKKLQDQITEQNNNLANMFTDYIESEEYNGTTSTAGAFLVSLTLKQGIYLIGFRGGSWLSSNEIIAVPPVLYMDDKHITTMNTTCIVSVTDAESVIKLQSPTINSLIWYNLKLYALRLK